VPAAAGARVVASDFYRGKVKSIYEREPLFRDFAEVQREYFKANFLSTQKLNIRPVVFENFIFK
jgi:hypothetical protein